MNGNPYTSSFIGATNQYPIYDYINSNIINASNYTFDTSNILELHSSNYTTALSNILQPQITATCNLIFKDNDCNTIVRISAQNIYYPITGNPVEIRFQNVENKYITKITQSGELFVYHPVSPLPAGYSPGWWSVENKLATGIIDAQGLRFDVTNLQAATGATAITDATTATAAATGAAAGVASAAATTAGAGTAIASGDYGTVALGLCGGALFSVLGYLSYQAQIKSNLTSNGFTAEAATVQTNMNSANLLVASNISNICIATGFTNCNMKTQQTIPNLNTNNITYNGVNISNVFLKQTGGTLTGALIAPNITTATSFIYQGNELSSTLGNYLLKAGGTLTGLLTTNSAINSTDGLQENAIYLSSKYLQLSSYDTNRVIQNDTTKLNYGIEKKYPPPRIYDNSTVEAVSSFLNQNAYIQTITINDYINGYGIGSYTIYSSTSMTPTNTQKKYLFNNDYIDTTNKAIWADLQYTAGVYSGRSNIKTGYNGDWVIIKLTTPILLTRFRFWCGDVNYAPALWRCYGSMDGITFSEIQEAEQTTRLLNTSYPNNYYEKTLSSSFTTPYLYIGFTIQKLIGNGLYLTFNELEIYGKELLNPIYNYISSNVLQTNYPSYANILTTMPNLSKKFGLSAVCNTSILMPNNNTYYKYDIDLRLYTTNKISPNPNTPYRVFKIRVFMGTVYFETLSSSGILDGILEYTVYQSNESTAAGNGASGINIAAIGEPRNYNLNSITGGSISLVRSADFNYLCVLSKVINTKVYIIIEDLLA